MSFIFDFPTDFLPKIMSGEYIRYGAIIKSAVDGRIVGHLVETPLVPSIMSKVPILGNLGGALFSVNKHIEVMNVLKNLQIISSVGAFSSILNLGVSFVGFALVLNRLNRMDRKLDSILHRLDLVRKEIEKVNIKLDELTESKLKSAVEMLEYAINSERIEERNKFIDKSFEEFVKLRNYFFICFRQVNPFFVYDFPVESALNLFGRYLICSSSLLKLAFFKNDFGLFMNTYNNIRNELSLFQFDANAAFEQRYKDAFENEKYFLPQYINDDVIKFLNAASNLMVESCNQIDSYRYEYEYVRRMKFEPFDYHIQLKARIEEKDLSDKGVLLIVHV